MRFINCAIKMEQKKSIDHDFFRGVPCFSYQTTEPDSQHGKWKMLDFLLEIADKCPVTDIWATCPPKSLALFLPSQWACCCRKKL